MLGLKSVYADPCFAGGFIGADFDIPEDLSSKLPEQWREFNKQYIPVYLKIHPDKSKVSAGLACGFLWTICKGIKKGDVVISPDGNGNFRFGVVEGDYYYASGEILPHRRKVRWLDLSVPRSSFSEPLQNSTGSLGTVSNVTDHHVEIEKILGHSSAESEVVSTDPEILDPSAFAMEKHLEAFLVANWEQTLLANDFDIYEEDGERVGQQYATNAGAIDILAISKDKKRLLVIELKRVVPPRLQHKIFIKFRRLFPDKTLRVLRS
jgi:restriction system protein